MAEKNDNETPTFKGVWNDMYFDTKNSYKIYIKIMLSFAFILLFAILNFTLVDKKSWILPKNIDNIGSNFKSFFTILYYVVTTWFTVGYGDITPGSHISKILAMLKMVVAYSIAFL